MSMLSVFPHIGFDEFLGMEAGASQKHELLGGVVYAMERVDNRHNDVVANLANVIGVPARAQGYRPRVANQLVRVDDAHGLYPDFGVYCLPDAHEIYATTPCLLAEVLSTTSHERDKVTKLAFYRWIDSLRAYLIVDPDSRTMVAHLQDERGRWFSSTCCETDVLHLPCPNMPLSVGDLFL